jgi:hypothetical protein
LGDKLSLRFRADRSFVRSPAVPGSLQAPRSHIIMSSGAMV